MEWVLWVVVWVADRWRAGVGEFGEGATRGRRRNRSVLEVCVGAVETTAIATIAVVTVVAVAVVR